MNQQAMLSQLYSALAAMRHIMFWLKWAFYVLFVTPSVMLCTALALYSGFSFASIPRELLQSVAQAAKNPAAPEGYLTVQTCKDPKSTGSGSAVPTPVMCKEFGFEQKSIESMAREASRFLWIAYALAAFFVAFCASMFGVFDRSRRAFLASIIDHQL